MRAALASYLPKRLSKVGVLAERSKKKSKKHYTRVSLFTKSAKNVGALLPNTQSGTLAGLAGLSGLAGF